MCFKTGPARRSGTRTLPAFRHFSAYCTVPSLWKARSDSVGMAGSSIISRASRLAIQRNQFLPLEDGLAENSSWNRSLKGDQKKQARRRCLFLVSPEVRAFRHVFPDVETFGMCADSRFLLRIVAISNQEF
jgi:hypothetical protein